MQCSEPGGSANHSFLTTSAAVGSGIQGEDSKMRRREFILGLGSAAAWPVVAWAQQPALPVVGFLGATSPNEALGRILRRGLSEMGYVEGQNVAIEYRYAEYQYDRLPALAADLVRRHVAVIVVSSSTAATPAKAATTTIPIVFATGADPVALGLVASLNRPGGNLTGIVSLEAELAPKQFQLLRDLIPNATTFGVLADPVSAGQSALPDLQAAARTMSLQLIVVETRTNSDLETAFVGFSQQRVGAVLVANSAFYNRRTEQLAVLAAHHALPTVCAFREYVLAGALMSYGNSLGDAYHQAGVYAGRILKGEKPADLPVERPTKFELVPSFRGT
jgi:putative ABC transport system substrate-binding protein